MFSYARLSSLALSLLLVISLALPAFAGGGSPTPVPQIGCSGYKEFGGTANLLSWHAWGDSCADVRGIGINAGVFGVDVFLPDGSGYSMVSFGMYPGDELGDVLSAWSDVNCDYMEAWTHVDGPRDDYVVGTAVCSKLPQWPQGLRVTKQTTLKDGIIRVDYTRPIAD